MNADSIILLFALIFGLIIILIKLIKKNRELVRLAYFDSMTGLYNRRFIEEILKKEIAMIGRYGYESCIILLDIDNFKEINDKYGHPVGDSVINKLSLIIKKNIRVTDEISRWGGDEFLILLTQTSVEDGYLVAEKLRRKIREEIILVKEKQIHITSSFGIAQLNPGINDSLEIAYVYADRALYKAKENGKNRIESA